MYLYLVGSIAGYSNFKHCSRHNEINEFIKLNCKKRLKVFFRNENVHSVSSLHLRF